MFVSGANTALVLSGGGARAAYQVGVLGAIRDLLPDKKKNPFPIICGTSAGALTSYLLFERSYTSALIALGRRDTLARRDEVLGFLKA